MVLKSPFRCLLHECAQAHHFVGHRWFSAEVDLALNPSLPEIRDDQREAARSPQFNGRTGDFDRTHTITAGRDPTSSNMMLRACPQTKLIAFSGSTLKLSCSRNALRGH